LDPLSRFATVHFPDRHTHTQTDRWSRRMFYSNTAYTLAKLIESDALIIWKGNMEPSVG